MDDFLGLNELQKKIYGKLQFLYGQKIADELDKRIAALADKYLAGWSDRDGDTKGWFDEKDIILITYGDQIRSADGNPPLKNLAVFLKKYYRGIINTIHVLPFYPYSSDDGFSVIDYRQVDKGLGTWDDIKLLSENFRIMFDAVINHISSQSHWFKEYLKANPAYKDYFIEAGEGEDLSRVTRPRTLPLLTKFNQAGYEKNIWTTFSEDQIDLNYATPEVLLDIMDLLLFYIDMGASMLRLDAIGYLWKKIGTTCINLEETHTAVRLLRDVIDAVRPDVKLVTETNIPHRENVSYFGNGYNEAQMVYQFSLPPLVLHAFFRGTASYLANWADALEFPSERTTYMNFLASHDGIGVMPVKDILPETEIQELCKLASDRGGNVSYKNNPDGTVSPYELNIVYFNAVANPEEDQDRQIDMFLCAHAIMLSLRGIPGIYVHSLLGSQNYQKGVEITGRYRSINREKFDMEKLEEELGVPGSIRCRVAGEMRKLIAVRIQHGAFHPNGLQKIIHANPQVFSMSRFAPDMSETTLCMHNVSGCEQRVEIKLESYMPRRFTDLLSGKTVEAEDGMLKVILKGYQAAWYCAMQ